MLNTLNRWLIEREIGLTEDEVDQVIASTHEIIDGNYSDFEDPRAFLGGLLEVEKKLNVWQCRLSLQEHKNKRLPSKVEVLWIKRIQRFYHVFVRFAQLHFEERKRNHTRRIEVYISYSEVDGNSYATPLANFLKSNQVRCFVDNCDIAFGTSDQEEILYGAVTCRKMWCVLSEHVIGEPMPMRELMIGYTRHLQERSRGFTLVLDCLERGPRPFGLWMERARSMASLQLYDEFGSHQAFPGNMQRAQTEEAYDRRIERIALELFDGKTILQAGPLMLVEYEQFPMSLLTQKILASTNICFLNTWISNLGALQDALIQALKSGATLKILLLSPESPLGDARNRALEASSQPVPPEYLKAGTKWNLDMIKYLCEQARASLNYVEGHSVQVRFYNTLPSMTLYLTDESVLMGFLFHGRMSINCPHVEVSRDTYMGKAASNEFDILWKSAH